MAFAPVIVFVLFNGVFLLLEVAPDPDVATLAGGDPLCGRRVELDEFDTLPMCKSTGEQYRDFWERVFTLDFGKSFFNNRPISDSIEERWGSSAELVVLAVLFSVLIAFGLGAAPAFRQSRVGTPGARFVGAVLMGAPLVAVATYAIVYPFEWWNYAPPVGRSIS
ncbi:MAG TPA: hypothetical protein VJP07_09775, partial [Dehalococcoidia bacterium]|nr:hypothetical protein [Dehalococcoidia bacterium]